MSTTIVPEPAIAGTAPGTTGLDPAVALRAFVDRWLPEVRARSAEGETRCRLPEDLIADAKAHGLFGAALGADRGGLQIDPLTIVELVEQISAADGATGWCTLIGNATSFMAWLAADVAAELAPCSPRESASSVFAPSGRMVPDRKGNVVLNGRWRFASGCMNSETIHLGAIVFDDDTPRMRSPGVPDWRWAFVRMSDVEILDTWDTLGLRGTGSNDIEVRNLTVPIERVAAPMFDPPRSDAPLYRLGFWGMLPIFMAGFPLGVARRALDEFEATATIKTHGVPAMPLAADHQVQYDVALAEGELRAARALVFDSIGAAWGRAVAGDAPTTDEARMLFLSARTAMAAARKAVDTVYGWSGGSVVYRDHPIQRCFRDIHTGSQHMAFGASGMRGFAKEQFGLPA